MEKGTGKLKKVVFVYENTVSTLTGKQCEEWLNDVNGMCSFMQLRGMNPFEHKKYIWIDEDIRESKFERILKEDVCPECLNDLVISEGCYCCDRCGYKRSC